MRLKAFLKRLYEEYENDAVADSAAALGYYFVFSLFPFLFFLATLTAFIPYVRRSVDTILARAHAILPAQAVGLIETHLRELVETPRPHLLTLGLLATLYSASRGVDALRKTLNLAYDVKESRKWWKTELVAFGMTIGGAVLVLIAIAPLTAGGSGGLLAGRQARHRPRVRVGLELAALAGHGAGDHVVRGARVLRAAGREAEVQVHHARIGDRHAGLAAGDLGLLGHTPAHFGSYNVTYGSIGGVIVLLTWFYISGFIFLMGGEMNAIIEHASPDGKESGARAPGEAPPPPSERPSAMPAGAADSAAAAARSKGGIPPEAQGAHR